jgi:hypothetical protein
MSGPQRGDFVRVRTRRWLVEDERSAGDGLTALRLACVCARSRSDAARRSRRGRSHAASTRTPAGA